MDNFYERLKIRSSASERVIKKGYWRLTHNSFPTKNASLEQIQRFVNIHIAFRILIVGSSRVLYDEFIGNPDSPVYDIQNEQLLTEPNSKELEDQLSVYIEAAREDASKFINLGSKTYYDHLDEMIFDSLSLNARYRIVVLSFALFIASMGCFFNLPFQDPGVVHAVLSILLGLIFLSLSYVNIRKIM